MFPEFLYRLSPRDEQVTPLEIVTSRTTGTSAALSTTSGSYVVPQGKVLYIGSIKAEGSTAGVSTVDRIRTQMFLDASVPIVLSTGDNFAASAFYDTENVHGNMYIPEGWSINSVGVYSSALAGNNIIQTILGILIPRGNFAV